MGWKVQLSHCRVVLFMVKEFSAQRPVQVWEV